jgi:SAM-dependent methyltransferase
VDDDPKAFDPKSYWENRLSSDWTLRGVGFSTMGGGFNEWAYRVRREVFMRAIQHLNLDLGSVDVLDVGSGTGFYIRCWEDLRVRSVSGIDLTDTAVARLTDSFPGATFSRGDVGDPGAIGERAYDVISAMDVMFHIIDDERFAQALANIRGALRPGGLFIWSDGFVRHDDVRDRHVAFRRLEDIERQLRTNSLEIVSRGPLFVLMNPPIDTRRTWPRRLWVSAAVTIARREAISRAVGRLLFPLELWLATHLRESPSTELMVCRAI